MRKVYVKRLFSVLMILVLLVGVVTFPSAAQEAAYTQLQQRENVTLKRLAGIPAEEAKIALSNAGFDTSDITDDMLSLFLKELQNGYSSDFSFDDRESYEPKEARHYTALLLYGRQIQRFFIEHDPQVAAMYLWEDGDATQFSARELCRMPAMECLEVLQSYGLKVPVEFFSISSLEYAASFAQTALEKCLAGDFDTYNYGAFCNVELSMRVQFLAMKYDPEVARLYKEKVIYPNEEQDGAGRMAIADLQRDASGLKDSTATGSWQSAYANYNCYAYAVGSTLSATPGEYSGLSPNLGSVSSIADAVVEDLDTFGYWAYDTTSRPTSLKSWERVMCVRTGSGDYHFMKSTDASSWFHKPGASVPLRWNYTSPAYKSWTDEGIFSDGYYPGTHTYNSTIYYIIYWAKGGPGPDINSLDPITE